MPATQRAVDLARAAASAAQEKNASSAVAIDVTGVLALTDVFVIASADNERQVLAIVDAVEERLHALSAKPIRREGYREGRWALMDFGDIIVHVQHDEERDFYDLERLWGDCPKLALKAGE